MKKITYIKFSSRKIADPTVDVTFKTNGKRLTINADKNNKEIAGKFVYFPTKYTLVK